MIRSEDISAFTADELRRYGRQLALPTFGVEGQRRLKSASVLVVGAGGLGSPAALYLAAAGVGRIGIVEFDRVEHSNLHRQLLYSSADVGRSKIDAARERINGVNPGVVVAGFEDRLTSANALSIMRGFDMVLDGSDNFPTRYLVNDAVVIAGIPCVYGSVHRFEGQLSVFSARGGPCYRCLFREPPPAGAVPNCAEAGVLGVLPGIIGTLQATEAIKLIAGIGEPLVGRLLLYDASRMTFRDITLSRDPECPVCGDAPTIRTLVGYDETCGVPMAEMTEMGDLSRRSSGEAKAEVADLKDEMTVDELHQWRESGHAHMLVDVREPFEHA